MKINIDRKTIEKVENILKKYPFWLLRIDTGGLGAPSNYNYNVASGQEYITGSVVESTAEYEDSIKRKLNLIDNVYALLEHDEKELIRLRYFENNSPDEVIEEMNICKTKYYNLRKSAFYNFALAFGYIKE